MAGLSSAKVFCITFSILFSACSSFLLEDHFEEELYLKPLPSGHIYSNFQFTTIWNVPFEAESCELNDLGSRPPVTEQHQFSAVLLIYLYIYSFCMVYLFHYEFYFTVQHCHLFPRAVGEVLGHYNVQELHLSLTEGLWRHEKFGYPVVDAPPGAELWAWFKEGTEEYETLTSNRNV